MNLYAAQKAYMSDLKPKMALMLQQLKSKLSIK